jgi:hypothetical protein
MGRDHKVGLSALAFLRRTPPQKELRQSFNPSRNSRTIEISSKNDIYQFVKLLLF